MPHGPWSGVAAAYARSFAGLCAGTVPAVLEGVTAGDRLLDVGCGPGVLAADAVRRGARVVACDLDEDMVRLARGRLGADAPTLVAALPRLPLAGAAVDVACANFVLNHVDDPAASAAELVRVTAPGGAVVATTWSGTTTAQGRLFGEVMRASGAVDPSPARPDRAPGLDRSPDGLVRLLRAAGCRAAHGRVVSWEWRVTPDDLWAAPVGGVAGVGAVWRAQTPAVQHRMRRELERLTRPLLEDGHLVLPATAVLVRGTV